LWSNSPPHDIKLPSQTFNLGLVLSETASELITVYLLFRRRRLDRFDSSGAGSVVSPAISHGDPHTGHAGDPPTRHLHGVGSATRWTVTRELG
jgi:hypothetical protein